MDYPEIDDEDEFSAEMAEHHRSIDALLRPAFSRNTSAVSTVSNISHGSSKSVDMKKREGPLPPTPSTTTLATLATVKPKRMSASSTAPSTHTQASGSSTAVSTSSGGVSMTKRQYALHELLSSERAYASDLALVREVHIPLALGRLLAVFYDICANY